jgi:hypothetical protein
MILLPLLVAFSAGVLSRLANVGAFNVTFVLSLALAGRVRGLRAEQ